METHLLSSDTSENDMKQTNSSSSVIENNEIEQNLQNSAIQSTDELIHTFNNNNNNIIINSTIMPASSTLNTTSQLINDPKSEVTNEITNFKATIKTAASTETPIPTITAVQNEAISSKNEQEIERSRNNSKLSLNKKKTKKKSGCILLLNRLNKALLLFVVPFFLLICNLFLFFVF